MISIYRRELNARFNGMSGYIFCAFVLLFAGLYCVALNIRSGYSHFEYVLNYLAFIFIIAIPILTMGVIADDFKLGTAPLLYSLPVSMVSIVLGKFFSLCTVILVPTVVLGLYPLSLTRYGSVPLVTAYGTLFAFFLLCVALASIGMLLSSLTDSPTAAAAMCFAVLLVLYYSQSLSKSLSSSAALAVVLCTAFAAGSAWLVRRLSRRHLFGIAVAAIIELPALIVYILKPDALSRTLQSVLSVLGVFDSFYVFVDGIFDLKQIIYLLSVTLLMVFFTVQVMEGRRWAG